MGKHLVPAILGFAAGVGVLGMTGKLNGVGEALSNGVHLGDKKTTIDVGAPTTKIEHLAAFALATRSEAKLIKATYRPSALMAG